jgi:hypothetical protein
MIEKDSQELLEVFRGMSSGNKANMLAYMCYSLFRVRDYQAAVQHH